MNRRDFLKSLLATGAVAVATPEALAEAGLEDPGGADVIWFPDGYTVPMPMKPDLVFLNGILLAEFTDTFRGDYSATDSCVIFMRSEGIEIKKGDVIAVTFWEKSVAKKPVEEQGEANSLLEAINASYMVSERQSIFYLLVGDPKNPFA